MSEFNGVLFSPTSAGHSLIFFSICSFFVFSIRTGSSHLTHPPPHTLPMISVLYARIPTPIWVVLCVIGLFLEIMILLPLFLDVFYGYFFISDLSLISQIEFGWSFAFSLIYFFNLRHFAVPSIAFFGVMFFHPEDTIYCPSSLQSAPKKRVGGWERRGGEGGSWERLLSCRGVSEPIDLTVLAIKHSAMNRWIFVKGNRAARTEMDDYKLVRDLERLHQVKTNKKE